MTTSTTRETSRSQEIFAEAQRLLPGGVDSPVRAFASVGGQPPFIRSGRGSHITDVDGNTYIDYVCSWGPLILGHADPDIVAAVQQTVALGASFGAPSPLEVELARAIHEAMPSIEMIRFVNSGTEATMSALRLARAATGRTKILKFDGCYHGHADSLLVQAGSGVATLGLPDSPGVPPAVAATTISVAYNDLAAVERAFAGSPGEVATVIVEPIAANMGVVPPAAGFLAGLREICSRAGALLIFDEVISGFRAAPGGAQELYGVVPDLTCLGKIVGGGLPVGAYGGRADLMSQMAPSGPVYQAGTLSGNPLAMAAGLATIRRLRDRGVYEQLERLGAQLQSGLASAIATADIAAQVSRVGSLLTLFFTDAPIRNYDDARGSDRTAFAAFHRAMLDRGIYLPPSQFEAWFVSTAHTPADIELTQQAATAALVAVKDSRGAGAQA